MKEYRVMVYDEEAASDPLRQLAQCAIVEPINLVRGRVLVTGGARSGKSSWAEKQFADREICYVATSQANPEDQEWVERIQLHRDRRPENWQTIETMELATLLDEPGKPLLVDCLSVWLSRVLDEAGAWDGKESWRDHLESRVRDLVESIQTTKREVIFVTNEVGSGIVPATSSGRLYRDELGRLNSRVAAHCDQVWQVVVGIARRMK